MRRRTLVGVPGMPQVGEALEVRRARVEDARALASLLGSAFEGETWDAAGVEDPGWRRKGLARAVVVGVLELAEQAGCMDAYLETRTDRLAAIALYMQLGFEPLVAEDWEGGSAVSASHVVPREVWTRVMGALRS